MTATEPSAHLPVFRQLIADQDKADGQGADVALAILQAALSAAIERLGPAAAISEATRLFEEAETDSGNFGMR